MCCCHVDQGDCLQSVRGRPIAVDWAVSKAAFQAGQPDETTGSSLGSKARGINLNPSQGAAQLMSCCLAAVSATAVETEDAGAFADAEGSESHEEVVLHSTTATSPERLWNVSARLDVATRRLARGKQRRRRTCCGDWPSSWQTAKPARWCYSRRVCPSSTGPQVCRVTPVAGQQEKVAARPKAVLQAARTDKEKAGPQQEKEGRTPAASPASQAAEGAWQAELGNKGINQTVFVRGLLSNSTKQELQARLESFGSIQACRSALAMDNCQLNFCALIPCRPTSSCVCRLVINPNTKQPKGTAFVEFKESAAAAKAADASQRGRQENSALQLHGKCLARPGSSCSVCRSGEGPGVSLAGRLLDIDVALTQHDARAMAAQNSGPSRPKDKRNLYLVLLPSLALQALGETSMCRCQEYRPPDALPSSHSAQAKEGAVEEGSPAWASMSKGDQQRRKRASMEKATKLRSPNFFVSPTRLSLRNLPFSLDEKALKSLLVAAVRIHLHPVMATDIFQGWRCFSAMPSSYGALHAGRARSPALCLN